jgi:cytochrome b561
VLKRNYTLIGAAVCALIAIYNIVFVSWAMHPGSIVRFFGFTIGAIVITRNWWRQRRGERPTPAEVAEWHRANPVPKPTTTGLEVPGKS